MMQYYVVEVDRTFITPTVILVVELVYYAVMLIRVVVRWIQGRRRRVRVRERRWERYTRSYYVKR